jgi:hypothetical protein
MGGRTRLVIAIVVAFSVFATGCLRTTPLPPTRGYGAPYKGTGETIFVKDSRTDWDISEGERKLTSEQALEASGDEEYETRRQIMKAHNDALYRTGKKHRRDAKKMIYASLAMIAVGWIGGTIMAYATKSETVVPATAMMPATRTVEPSSTSNLFSAVGVLMVITGSVGIGYGFYGAIKPPPYVEWHVPRAMDRPAYIRQQVEPYNEKLTPANPIPSKRPSGPTLPGRPPGARPGGPPGARPGGPPLSPSRPARPHEPPPRRIPPRGGR